MRLFTSPVARVITILVLACVTGGSVLPSSIAPAAPAPGWGVVTNGLALQPDGSCTGELVLEYSLKDIDVEGQLITEAGEAPCSVSVAYETGANAQPLSPNGWVVTTTTNPLLAGSPWTSARVLYAGGCPAIYQVERSHPGWELRHDGFETDPLHCTDIYWVSLTRNLDESFWQKLLQYAGGTSGGVQICRASYSQGPSISQNPYVSCKWETPQLGWFQTTLRKDLGTVVSGGTRAFPVTV